MNLTHLTYFVEIAETRSISKAADNLFLTRQALSQAIRALEKELDAELLLRERSGIALTPEGECLQRNAVQLLALWSNAQEELNAIQRAKRKTIRVGFGLMSYNLWDVDHIQRFQALHPNVDVAVSALVPDELWSSLAERKLDIIVTGVRRGGQQVRDTLLCRRRMLAMLSKDDPLAGLEAVSPEDLAGKTVFLLRGNTDFSREVERFFEDAGVDVAYQFLPSQDLVSIFRTVERYRGVYFTTGIFTEYLQNPETVAMRPIACAPSLHIPQKDVYAYTLLERAEEAPLLRYIQFLKEGQA